VYKKGHDWRGSKGQLWGGRLTGRGKKGNSIRKKWRRGEGVEKEEQFRRGERRKFLCSNGERTTKPNAQ